MKNILQQGLLIVFSALLFSTTASAKTPDGETPSTETICDVFADTKGPAFGLCNAYCEALDCGDPNQAASSTACMRVRDNFERLTGLLLPVEPVFNEEEQLLNNCTDEPITY